MATETKTPTVNLDWSRLLAFDQIPKGDDRGAVMDSRDRDLTKLGAKIGQKKGAKRMAWPVAG